MKEGWEIKTLEEACEMYQPKTISKKEMTDDGEYTVFGANGVIGKYDKYNHEEPQLLITCRGATCGSVNISTPKSWINGNAMVVRPKDNSIDLKFLEYMFRGGIDLSETISGAAQPQITRKSLNPVQIAYPKSLPEQQRIVSILDQAFAAIDKAKANAEENLQNAKELFESYLQGVFENGDWEIKVLNEITEVKDGTHDSPKYIKEGIPFVTQKNIKPDGLTLADTKFITDQDHEKFYKRSNVTYGDILISMIGANRGMAAIVDDKRTFSIKNVGLIKECELVNMSFLLYYLKSPNAQKYVADSSNGGAQEFVGLRALRSFPIPLPSLDIQNKLVEQLDSLRAETQKLEAVYQKKMNDLDEMKKSILQKAFAGELETEKAVAV